MALGVAWVKTGRHLSRDACAQGMRRSLPASAPNVMEQARCAYNDGRVIGVLAGVSSDTFWLPQNTAKRFFESFSFLKSLIEPGPVARIVSGHFMVISNC